MKEELTQLKKIQKQTAKEFEDYKNMADVG